MARKTNQPIEQTVNQSVNFSKTFFELFKTYWGYFMTFVAATTFVWTIGVKSERNNNEKDSIKKDIVEIKNVQKDQNTKIDSVLYIVNDVNQSQREVVANQNALRNSYVNFVANFNDNKSQGLSTKQFLEYMEGIQFQLKPPEIKVDTIKTKSDIPTFSIDVRRSEK